MQTDLQELFQSGSDRAFPAGQILLYEGDPVDRLFYIVEGYVKVYSIQDSGSLQIIFIDGPGDAFPLTSYLSGAKIARYFYECMADCEFLTIPGEEMDKKIKDNLELGDVLMRYTNQMSQQFLKRIEILSVNDARRKIISLVSFLESKASANKTSHKLDIPLTHQDIAAMCGMSRETASIQLARLKREGAISGTRNIQINPVKLKQLKQELSINF